MNASGTASYYLLWKGRQSGPFSLPAIREKLASGEINRMHQIHLNGSWAMLGEFLEEQDRGDAESHRRAEAAQRQAEVAQREEQVRREHEAQLAAERAQQGALQERLLEAESRQSVPPPPPAYSPVSSSYLPGYPLAAPTRTSGLAIAAFVLSLCNFIPYVGLVTFILAIVFGHIALSQIKHDPTLGGRGLAIAALVITYVLLALGIIAGFVYALVVAHVFRL